MPLDVLVAISDDGMIRRLKQLNLPEVLKADQISGRIQEILKGYRRAYSLFTFNAEEGGYEYRADELAGLCAFLPQHHRPLRPSSPPPQRLESTPSTRSALCTTELTVAAHPDASPTPAEPAAAGEQNQCRGCQSGRLSVEWGRYGYYFKCADCGGNTPSREICANCGEKEKLRKSGPQFFAECAACRTSRLYFVNSA